MLIVCNKMNISRLKYRRSFVAEKNEIARGVLRFLCIN